MQSVLSNEYFIRLSKLINHELGLYYPASRKSDLENALKHPAQDSGFSDSNAFAEFILNSNDLPGKLDILTRYLTIGETYFFREAEVLKVFRKAISETKGQVNIWSAGCCSGEEPYTIAIILKEVFKPAELSRFNIIGTDVNKEFLRKAVQGRYKEWSFRAAGEEIRNKYFCRLQSGDFQISQDIRQMVKFEQFNLATGLFENFYKKHGCFDFIFCRNVLMYFNESLRCTISGRFFRGMQENGLLIVSMTEVSGIYEKHFRRVFQDNTFLYKKGGDISNVEETVKKTASESILHLHEKSKQCGHSASLCPVSDEVKPEQKAISVVGDKSKLSNGIFVRSNAIADPKEEYLQAALKDFSEGNYMRVIAVLDRILNNDKKIQILNEHLSAEVYKLLIKSLVNACQADRAISVCKIAIDKHKLNSEFYFLYSGLLVENGRYDDAIVYLKRAIFLEPDYIMAHFSLATAYRRLKNIKEARRHFVISENILKKLRKDESIKDTDGLTAGSLCQLLSQILMEI